MTTAGLELRADEIDLLIWNVPNEVINGFRVDDFQNRISMSEEQFKDLSNRIRVFSEKKQPIVLYAREARAFRNALRIVIQELGPEEFHTRTGYEFSDGQAIFGRLDTFCEGQT